MTPRAQTAFNKTKAQRDEFCGVDVSYLTPAERREIAIAGLSLSVDRQHRIVATYPARLRAQDLRNKVTKKIDANN